MDPQITLNQWLQTFGFGGLQYPFVPSQTLLSNKEDIASSFQGYVQGAYQSNGVIFACQLVRLMLFSEARFLYRRLGENGRPGELWAPNDGRNPASSELGLLALPWTGATTGDLLARAIQDADLGGNFYGLRRRGQIKRLRPDWMTIVLGSDTDPNDDDIINGDLDAEVIGYIYHPGGPAARRDPVVLDVNEVMHFAPIPDPIASFRGMSWLTPVIREIMSDSAATTHKLKFFENGATVNMVVSLDSKISKEAFDKWIEVFRTQHEGALNAYKTLYLAGGATVEPVGSNFEQMDFKTVQGAGETRIAAAAGVPPVIVGLSEGLAAATYSNYGQARRRLGDGTMRPLWRNFAGSAERIIRVPSGNELWYDDRDIAFLREDRKDAAEIAQIEASSMQTLINSGFEPASVVDALAAGDYSRLKHTGLVSVQLQPPGTVFTPTPQEKPALPTKKGDTQPALPAKGGKNGA